MNILITSAGKRVSLVRLFQKELRRHFPSSRVFTTELNPRLSPAAHISDGCFELPRVTSPEYIAELHSVCLSNDIKLIVPTIDTELITLSSNAAKFQADGIEVLISDPDFISVCRDKRKTHSFFREAEIPVPEGRDIDDPVFPIFAKPFDGSLSKDLYIIRSHEDISADIRNNEKLIFMELVDTSRYKEFTVDMYYGKDNRVKYIVPRERLEVRAGEINKGYTRKNFLVEYLKEKLDRVPGVRGCICLQLFLDETQGSVYGIEINPRFGGGYPLTYYAGANFQESVIKEYLLGEPLEYSHNWKADTLMLRYDNEIIVYEEDSRF